MVKLYASLLAITLATNLVLASSETVSRLYTKRDLDEEYCDAEGQPNFGITSESEKELPVISHNTRRTGLRRVRQLYTEPDPVDEEFFERGYDDDYIALEARAPGRVLHVLKKAASVGLTVAPFVLLRRDYPSNDYGHRRDLEGEEELSRRDLDAGELFVRV